MIFLKNFTLSSLVINLHYICYKYRTKNDYVNTYMEIQIRNEILGTSPFTNAFICTNFFLVKDFLIKNIISHYCHSFLLIFSLDLKTFHRTKILDRWTNKLWPTMASNLCKDPKFLLVALSKASSSQDQWIEHALVCLF